MLAHLATASWAKLCRASGGSETVADANRIPRPCGFAYNRGIALPLAGLPAAIGS